MNLTVVVCHFQENLDWIKQIKYPVVVYNKNPDKNNLYEKNLPNVGYDAIAYLTYIIDNYDNLPDFVCFSQDDPFTHCPNFINNVNNFDTTQSFYPLGISYIRDVDSIVKETVQYAENVHIEYNLPIKFISGAQCIVSKKLILQRSKESYEKIKKSIPLEVKSQINYLIEYLWPTILGFNETLVVGTGTC
jgi:hypothetical protein